MIYNAIRYKNNQDSVFKILLAISIFLKIVFILLKISTYPNNFAQFVYFPIIYITSILLLNKTFKNKGENMVLLMILLQSLFSVISYTFSVIK